MCQSQNRKPSEGKKKIQKQQITNVENCIKLTRQQWTTVDNSGQKTIIREDFPSFFSAAGQQSRDFGRRFPTDLLSGSSADKDLLWRRDVIGISSRLDWTLNVQASRCPGVGTTHFHKFTEAAWSDGRPRHDGGGHAHCGLASSPYTLTSSTATLLF